MDNLQSDAHINVTTFYFQQPHVNNNFQPSLARENVIWGGQCLQECSGILVSH